MGTSSIRGPKRRIPQPSKRNEGVPLVLVEDERAGSGGNSPNIGADLTRVKPPSGESDPADPELDAVVMKIRKELRVRVGSVITQTVRRGTKHDGNRAPVENDDESKMRERDLLGRENIEHACHPLEFPVGFGGGGNGLGNIKDRPVDGTGRGPIGLLRPDVDHPVTGNGGRRPEGGFRVCARRSEGQAQDRRDDEDERCLTADDPEHERSPEMKKLNITPS